MNKIGLVGKSDKVFRDLALLTRKRALGQPKVIGGKTRLRTNYLVSNKRRCRIGIQFQPMQQSRAVATLRFPSHDGEHQGRIDSVPGIPQQPFLRIGWKMIENCRNNGITEFENGNS
jgi:hypothetical protein